MTWRRDFLAHAREVFPEECGGYVVGDTYWPLDNEAENKREAFFASVSQVEFLAQKLEERARQISMASGSTIGYVLDQMMGRGIYVVHSHPGGELPSKTDEEQLLALEATYEHFGMSDVLRGGIVLVMRGAAPEDVFLAYYSSSGVKRVVPAEDVGDVGA